MTAHSGITERRDASGRVRFQVRVRRAGGSQVATLPTLAEALRWRAEALAAADGTQDPPERPRRSQPLSAPPGRAATVQDAARRLCRGMRDGTIRTNRGETYKPSVVRTYEIALRLDVLPRIGAVPVATLRRGDVQRLVDELAAQRSHAHARKSLVALRVAERYEELDGNPCDRVTVPRVADAERPPYVLSPEEGSALIKAAEHDDVRFSRSFAAPLVALGLGTGLRIGELLALAWGPDGLDVDAGIVRVRRALDRNRTRAAAIRSSPRSPARRAVTSP